MLDICTLAQKLGLPCLAGLHLLILYHRCYHDRIAYA